MSDESQTRPLLISRLPGKTREQIEKLISKISYREIAGIIQQLIELEPHLAPEEIMALRKLPRRRVIALLKSGQIRGHKPDETKWRAPLSAVRAWDEATRVTPLKQKA